MSFSKSRHNIKRVLSSRHILWDLKRLRIIKCLYGMQVVVYGCDICQEVCPWNRFSTPHQEPAFTMPEKLKEMRNGDWLELTEEIFSDLFSKSAVNRAGYEGLMRNIKFLSSADQ